MLDEFSQQVLRPLALRNGLGGDVRLRLNVGPTETELDQAFSRFVDERQSLELLYQALKPPDS